MIPLASINGHQWLVQEKRRFLCQITGFSPEILRGGKSLDVYAGTNLLQPSGDYSNGLVNCAYYKINPNPNDEGVVDIAETQLWLQGSGG